VTLHDLATPAVLVDPSRARANIDRMQAAADAVGVRLRPHAKTHKSPIVAGWQLARGAVGICCAKLGEAEVFAEAGVADIRVPYPLQPVNAPRVLALLDRTRLSFIVDDLDVARAWSRAMAGAGRDVEVLVKVDVGFHRCGIDPDRPDAVAMVAEVAALPGLRFRGLLSHAGHAYHATSEADLERMAREEIAILSTLAEAVRAHGVEVPELSAGATPPARFSLAQRSPLTEFRPGNYVYFDRTMVGLHAATLDDCALTVLATVVSASADGSRLVLDCGSKTLTADGARGFVPSPGHGTVYRDPTLPAGASPDSHLIVERLSEEHATVRVTPGGPAEAPGPGTRGVPAEAAGYVAPKVGDRVRLVPNHACVVSNLVDAAWLVDGATVVERLPIAARGRIQ
jgi:D-serine deaminase-like pyridoxal phosphate-dependent protein